MYLDRAEHDRYLNRSRHPRIPRDGRLRRQMANWIREGEGFSSLLVTSHHHSNPILQTAHHHTHMRTHESAPACFCFAPSGDRDASRPSLAYADLSFVHTATYLGRVQGTYQRIENSHESRYKAGPRASILRSQTWTDCGSYVGCRYILMYILRYFLLRLSGGREYLDGYHVSLREKNEKKSNLFFGNKIRNRPQPKPSKASKSPPPSPCLASRPDRQTSPIPLCRGHAILFLLLSHSIIRSLSHPPPRGVDRCTWTTVNASLATQLSPLDW